MKKIKNILILCIILAFITGLPLVSLAGIAGSDHDFSSEGWNTSGEICKVCHTPHNADTTVSAAPLWNHEVSTATYTVYSSTTMNATVDQPGGVSKLCLSCHDGTVAIDSFAGASGSNFIDGGELVGTDLSNDHPVSFTYDSALATADGSLYDPSTQTSGLGGTIAQDMLFGNKVECASCHDVHDETNGSFLRIDNTGSALCLTCHNK